MQKTTDLTNTERLILINQYEILSRLANDKNDKHSYNLIAEQLRNGHKWLYQQAFENIKIKNDLSEEDTSFVLAILSLHDALLESYDQLISNKETDLHEDDVTFKGFHRETEEHLASFVHALKKANFFVNSIGTGHVISPKPMTGIYKKMIDRWEHLGRGMIMSHEQVLQVIGKE